MSFNPLSIFKRHRIARAGVGLLVLTGAAFAEYRLANVQRPVNLETTGKFSPATIRFGQKLIIEGPVVDPEEGMLFSHDGKKNETVNVNFKSARLDEETRMLVESPTLPSDPTAIDYQAQEPKSSAAGGEPCRTQVKLSAATKTMPYEIHIFQFGEPGENYRHLAMSPKGAELVSVLSTTAADDSITSADDSITLADDSKRAPGCQAVLKVGDWSKSVSKTIVTTVMAKDSDLFLSFNPRTPNEAAPWKDTEGFLPLDLGAEQLKPDDPPPFQAHSVSIKSLDPGNQRSLLSAESIKPDELLNIQNLKIGADQIQLTIVGKGWVTIDGNPWIVNFVKRLEDNKILGTLLAAANIGLLGWLSRLVFKTPSKPAPTQTP